MLGGWVVRRLHDDGRPVHGSTCGRRHDPPAGVEHTIADVRDRRRDARALAGADAVVHCAAALPSYARQTDPVGDRRGHPHRAGRRAGGGGGAGGPHLLHRGLRAADGRCRPPRSTPASPVDHYSARQGGGGGGLRAVPAAGMCVPILRPEDLSRPGAHGPVRDAVRVGRGGPELPDARPRRRADPDVRGGGPGGVRRHRARPPPRGRQRHVQRGAAPSSAPSGRTSRRCSTPPDTGGGSSPSRPGPR